MATATHQSEIELYFNKVMSPIKKEADPNLVAQFCQKLNSDFNDGISTAIRLIINKMQSEQEWESMVALYILEACVKNCGIRFHVEISKFRFLNEMIKLVSPKYLAHRTSDRVKRRCIEILYSWTKGLPNEVKIQEAYQMLKRQGLIDKDPTYVDTNIFITVPPREKNAIFDDPEKSKKLAKLLQSKNPQDLEEANRLIKTMAQQVWLALATQLHRYLELFLSFKFIKDEMKTEKMSTRITELEHLNDNVKLLADMLFHFNKITVNPSELETMKFIYDELEKKQPNLVQLAAETDDNDDGIGEIIKTNDNVMRVLNQYREVVDGEYLLKADGEMNDDVLMINTQNEPQVTQQKPVQQQQPLITTIETPTKPVINYDPFKELEEVFSTAAVQKQNSVTSNTDILSKYESNSDFGAFTDEVQPQAPPMKPLLPSPNSIDNLLNNLNLDTKIVPILPSAPPLATQTKQTPQQQLVSEQKPTASKGFDDLNQIGRTLLGQTINTNTHQTPQTLFQNTKKPVLTLNEIQQQKQHQQPNKTVTTVPNVQLTSDNLNITSDYTDLFNALNTIFVPIETVKPGSQKPLTIYESNDIKVVLHFGRDCPQMHVYVTVVSITSTNSSPINRLSFQAAVPKNMKVKLQPASSTELPAYNPILPPSAITQVMLIASPTQDKIRLKYKLSYTIADSVFNESADIEDLPVTKDLI